MMQDTSVSLLEKIRSPSAHEDWLRFDAIYRPFIARQLRTFSVLQGVEDDVAQEVMLVVQRSIGSFERQRTGSFRLWLRRMTLNQIRAALRTSKKHEKSLQSQQEIEDQLSQWEDPASIVSKRWDEEHDRQVYQVAVAQLQKTIDPKTWQAFECYVLNDEDPNSVAANLQISVNSVFLAKSRITRKLREYVAGLIDP